MHENGKDFEPKIMAFLCNWCSYAGADLAGVSRIQYPPNTRVIRVPCSGRVDPLLSLRKTVLEFLGVEPERVHFSWVSAGEGEKFSEVITEVIEKVKKAGPAEKMVKVR